jgi:hypothetical protein
VANPIVKLPQDVAETTQKPIGRKKQQEDETWFAL